MLLIGMGGQLRSPGPLIDLLAHFKAKSANPASKKFTFVVTGVVLNNIPLKGHIGALIYLLYK